MSHDPIHRWRQDCLRKRRYANKRNARRVAKRMAKDVKQKIYFYECGSCEGWHLTSMKWVPGKKDNKGVSP